MPTNRSVRTRLSFATAAGAGALVLLTACGGTDTAATPERGAPAATAQATTSSASSAPATQPGGSFDDADVMFAQMMIPHHRQAVEMAGLAATRAGDPEVKKLAAKIKAAQDPEIATMTGWLQGWGKPEPTGMGHMDHGMPGMMSAEDMDQLKDAKGAAFDKQFVRMMIAHHEGAIQMARTELAQGRDDAAKKLAQSIQSSQQAEIDQMKQILDRL
ncbi:DUF305 domain-containing protein [Nonomuraea rhodomycinica]|uniref:DUF305 domain-containing protein n=1 Tax=Nonomuraea rhodomycinica TaxID=1712872 RepID=A0A7Y6ISH6_9ACTN|nr:DUF305 domain-containing protein [Nonomuraea rhodomycinica]NUW43601.1 DUF305 domain-containing protein [Nonomuraea rhodomycinica]